MSLYNRQSDNTDNATTGATGNTGFSADPTSGFDQSGFNNDPMDNRAGAQHGTQFRDQGMGMASGGQGNLATQGGMTQGNYVPDSTDPSYNTRTGNTQGNFGNTEGLVAGGAAGGLANQAGGRHHHLHSDADPINNAGYTDQNQGYGNDTTNNNNFGNTNSGNTRRDLEGLAAGGAVGAVGVHEYEKHRHQGGGMGNYQNDPSNVEGDADRDGQYGAQGTGLGSGQYDSSNQYGNTDPTNAGRTNDPSNTNYGSNLGDNTSTGDYGSNTATGRTPGTTSNQNPDKEGKHLERSGKLDKVIGTLIGSDKMKEQGRQKQAEGAALRAQDGNNTYDNAAGDQSY